MKIIKEKWFINHEHEVLKKFHVNNNPALLWHFWYVFSRQNKKYYKFKGCGCVERLKHGVKVEIWVEQIPHETIRNLAREKKKLQK